MICPKCQFEQENHHTECPKCGIVFEKFHPHDNVTLATDTDKIETVDSESGTVYSIKDLFFSVQPEINHFFFIGRAIVFLVLIVWGWKFFRVPLESNYVGTCFLHLINIPFHEAGHIIFRPFGRIITALGGSLGQLLMPLICLAVFIIKTRDTFGASVSLWWFGENCMDIAPYINDARDLTLPLLGGNTGRTAPYGFHDWNFILTELGWLRYDRILASIAYKAGIFLMLISLVWGGYLLFKQYQHLER